MITATIIHNNLNQTVVNARNTKSLVNKLNRQAIIISEFDVIWLRMVSGFTKISGKYGDILINIK